MRELLVMLGEVYDYIYLNVHRNVGNVKHVRFYGLTETAMACVMSSARQPGRN